VIFGLPSRGELVTILHLPFGHIQLSVYRIKIETISLNWPPILKIWYPMVIVAQSLYSIGYLLDEPLRYLLFKRQQTRRGSNSWLIAFRYSELENLKFTIIFKSLNKSRLYRIECRKHRGRAQFDGCVRYQTKNG
jgi:hypothetical protein